MGFWSLVMSFISLSLKFGFVALRNPQSVSNVTTTRKDFQRLPKTPHTPNPHLRDQNKICTTIIGPSRKVTAIFAPKNDPKNQMLNTQDVHNQNMIDIESLRSILDTLICNTLKFHNLLIQCPNNACQKCAGILFHLSIRSNKDIFVQ